MRFAYQDELTGANLLLHSHEPSFEQLFSANRHSPFLTLAWNQETDQSVTVDGELFTFPADSFMPFVASQIVSFQHPEQLIIWQFDKPFYCIQTFDHEVSCMGYLFWGNKKFLAIRLDQQARRDAGRIVELFIDEFKTHDRLQGEVQRALLKRLIVKLNNMAKSQEINPEFRNVDLDLVRQFNVLVELHFRQLHKVQDYANLLNKSPKTLTNLFLLYNNKSALEVIHERLVLEAKRLLLYTAQSVKEIAFDLGFDEPTHFSRLFKNVVGLSPAEFKMAPLAEPSGEFGR